MPQTVEDYLKTEEGLVEEVYIDPISGLLHCGWGHLLVVGSPVPRPICEQFFRMDLAGKISDFYRIPLEYRRHLNETRAKVIICMIFQMGYAGVWGFKKMWAAILLDDWSLVSAEMLDSEWAEKETPERAKRLSNIMLSGIWPESSTLPS